MTCLNCQKHFSEHEDGELFVCINFYSSKYTELTENYRKLLKKTKEDGGTTV